MMAYFQGRKIHQSTSFWVVKFINSPVSVEATRVPVFRISSEALTAILESILALKAEEPPTFGG